MDEPIDPIRVCKFCWTLVHIEEVSQFIKDTGQVICNVCSLARPTGPPQDPIKRRIEVWLSKKQYTVPAPMSSRPAEHSGHDEPGA